MMKLLITLFLLSPFSMRACSAQPVQGRELKDNENSLLWKISGNGLQHDSYLFGTMHTVDSTFLDSVPAFRKAFIAAKQVAVECDLFAADSVIRSNKKGLKGYVYMPNDTTYAMLYSDDDFQFVDSVLRTGNSYYFNYKPMFWVSLFNGMKVNEGIENIRGTLDRTILSMGYRNNKEIHFMETLENVFPKVIELDSLQYVLDLHDQAKTLKYALKHPDSMRSFVNQMKEHYFKQELNHLSMDALLKKAKSMDGSESELVPAIWKYNDLVIVAARNEAWMENLIPMIHKDSSLIAVGVAHLGGTNGLIAKLRSRGYNVEPIR